MREIVYKQTVDAEGNSVELKMYIFEPAGHTAEDQRACIVFFFGGGWRFGSPQQFFPHCEYLAGRGMVAMAAEYRVKDRNGTTPFECVKDAKSAIRYIRAHAAELGVDPHQFVRAGLPPAIIFHGDNDNTVPIETARTFTESMIRAGNRCELIAYPGQGHGFFNKNRNTEHYMDTLKKADAFLVSLGFLEKDE